MLSPLNLFAVLSPFLLLASAQESQPANTAISASTKIASVASAGAGVASEASPKPPVPPVAPSPPKSTPGATGHLTDFPFPSFSSRRPSKTQSSTGPSASVKSPWDGVDPTIGGLSSGPGTTPPDVLLAVPKLSVGKIELDVENLSADLNLKANVANIVTINAGVAVSVQKVNITIADVEAELELVVRLGHLVDIVKRVFDSLDLNPLLISAINGVTDVVDTVVGAVDGLLGSITHGDGVLNFLVDNLGNIVQEVIGANGLPTTQSIVGNYLQNMTFTGVTQNLGNGNVQKQYKYSPLNALVNIVFNAAGQIVQATVAKVSGGSGASTSTAPPSATAAPFPPSTALGATPAPAVTPASTT